MRLFLPGFLLLTACSSAVSPPETPAASSPPASSAPPSSTIPPDQLCPALCALRPSAANPQALALKGQSPGVVRVILLWREPNGNAIQAISGINDLASRIRGIHGIELLLVSVDDNGARAAQARQELIDQETQVRLIFGPDAQEITAALAPETLPALYILDQQQRPVMRFDQIPDWHAPVSRTLFEGLTAGASCSFVVEDGKIPNGCKY